MSRTFCNIVAMESEPGFRRDRVVRARAIRGGMSQEKLAELSGYARHPSILKIESGETDPPASRVAAIAIALEVSAGWLFGEGSDDLYDQEGAPTLRAAIDDDEWILVEAYRLAPDAVKATLLAASRESLVERRRPAATERAKPSKPSRQEGRSRS